MPPAFQEWVELIEPDTYRLSDGRTLTFTPGDGRNAVARGNAMLRAGLRVPACWDHQADAQPVYLGHHFPVGNVSRDFFGEVTRYRVGPRGRPEGLLRIPDPADARQFRKVNGVSPRLQRDWVDEQGVRWAGLTVGHLAATPTPVQRRLRRPADLGHVPGRVVARAVYDLSHATRGAAMAAESDDTGGGGTVNDTGAIASILNSLAQLDINLGDGVVTDLAALDMALKVAVSVKTGGGDDLDDELGDDAPTNPAPMSPAVMSQFTTLAKAQGKDLERRVADLFRSGRVDGPTRTKLLGRLKAADLSHASFTPAGDLKPLPVVQQIAAYEELPPGAFAKQHRRPADLGHTTAADPPADPKAAEADAVVKRQEELAEQYSRK